MWSEVIMYMPATEIAMAESNSYFADKKKINNYNKQVKIQVEISPYGYFTYA